jgi:low temperature requirement protein LtrA
VTRRAVAVWRRRMLPRDSDEPHRASTPLELLFDLCFVVAVAQVSNEMHHYLARGDAATALPSYVAVFFAIWWAWMNFTWFASAYDTDDAAYRVATLVQITGALVLAAGVPRAFEHHDFTVIAAGYTIMRVALISQWLRAAHGHAAGPARTTALRYAVGLATSQALWLGWLFLPASWQMLVFPALALYDVAIPPWAERRRAISWHPHHIAERYGLFTLIVLGESILAATIAVQSALDEHQTGARLFVVAAGGLLTVFAMWWLYFAKPAHEFLTASNRASFLWGYGHSFVFASAAGVGAGVAVNVDLVTHHADGITSAAAAATVTVPVAIFVLVLWLLQVRPHRVGRLHDALFPAFALLVLGATPFGGAGTAVLLAGLLLVALVVVAAVAA